MQDDKLGSFELADYAKLLGQFQAKGYRTVGLHDLNPAEAHLYLRHDVDLSLERAFVMAQFEADLDITSSYFLLVSTALYNPASADSRRMLRRMIASGHEIGLHFDVTQVDEGEDLDAAAREECDLLAQICGRQIDTISFHRPARAFLDLAGRFAGRRHTYEPAFFSEIAYVSDSNGGWHHGHPLAHPAVANGTAMQLLTHPIWWVGDAPRSPVPLLETFVATSAARLEQLVVDTVTVYAQSKASASLSHEVLGQVGSSR